MAKQALWLEAIERRISATTAMLASMRGVKMTGLTDVLREDLQRLRVEELTISRKFRKLLIWTMGIGKSLGHAQLEISIDFNSLFLTINGADVDVCRIRNPCSEE